MDILNILAQNIHCGYGEAVLKSTHNAFLDKIKN